MSYCQLQLLSFIPRLQREAWGASVLVLSWSRVASILPWQSDRLVTWELPFAYWFAGKNYWPLPASPPPKKDAKYNIQVWEKDLKFIIVKRPKFNIQPKGKAKGQSSPRSSHPDTLWFSTRQSWPCHQLLAWSGLANAPTQSAQKHAGSPPASPGGGGSTWKVWETLELPASLRGKNGKSRRPGRRKERALCAELAPLAQEMITSDLGRRSLRGVP